MSDPKQSYVIQQSAKRTADYHKSHAKRDAILDQEQPELPGILPAPQLTNLHIHSIAIKNKGSRAETGNVLIEMIITGAARNDNLESIHNQDYYQAFLALAQAFQEEPTPTPNETASE